MEKHFLFEDTETKEVFLVLERNVTKAKEIAKEWFSNPRYICEYTNTEAEISGYDEY